MEKEINLPPFYVGQRVVALHNVTSRIGIETGIKKGNEYVILSVYKNPCCAAWVVDVGVRTGHKNIHCGICDRLMASNNVWSFLANRFAPIHENFQSITLEKVLEEETKLISVN